MKLIVGLGNPGKNYVRTRHNVGFLFLDTLNAEDSFTIDKKHSADVLKTTLHDKRVILAKPTTYMNDSGIPVQSLLTFYKITPNDLIVVHDDKDIPLGSTKVQRDRGAAGHNGIKSIIEHLGTKDFIRVRIGVAPQDGSAIPDTANFVLNKFSAEEQKVLKTVFENVVKEIESLL